MSADISDYLRDRNLFSETLTPTCQNSIHAAFYVQLVICWEIIVTLAVTSFNLDDGFRHFEGIFYRNVNISKSTQQNLYVFFPGLQDRTHIG